MSGLDNLQKAEWLLGFDFDGTLANTSDNHSVSQSFFETLTELKQQKPMAWGICTGRSLEFLMEGMQAANFPYLPDFVVAQERDLFYLNSMGQGYLPDAERNAQAKEALGVLMEANASIIQQVKSYVDHHSNGQWISIPTDPAGIIAEHESEIAEAVRIYEECSLRTPELHYQRNTIYLRFSHRDYCKGTAIQHLQNSYNLDHSKTLVMGDNYNDITMLNDDVAKYYGGPSNSIQTLKTELLKRKGFITKASYAKGVEEALRVILPL